MNYPAYTPPWFLHNGLAMTVYTALRASSSWESTSTLTEPAYQEIIFQGAQDVPIYGKVAIPENAHSTIIATYGITGDLNNQWFLKLLGRKAYAQGYAVVLFDWRAHGKTAELSPTLTSDGLYEGEDFVHIAAKAKALGCPAKFWFMGFSLGGQLALWAGKAAQTLTKQEKNLGLDSKEIAGTAVICPSLDSVRSLSYLVNHPLGKYLEQAIAKELKKLALALHKLHPQDIDLAAVERANSIWGFDHELVIGRLGFPSVEAYYEASSGLHILPCLEKPTLIIYAADDPLFDPTIIPDLQAAAANNPAIDLILTPHGGHVGYISSKASQEQAGDPDPWWAWNRVLQWCEQQSDTIE
ncbi:MAG: alpha/beta fold hydrolase [Nostocaceae cyanobacterium]|nr:alpha/beta fold hydrolase [Nostocaceae cyanobacterium]